MKFACSSYSYHEELEAEMSLWEFLRICDEELDVDGVELIDKHLPGADDESHLPEIDEETLDRVASEAADRDLEIACLSVFYNDFAKASSEERRADVQKVTAWLDQADHLDADVLRAFTGFPGQQDRDHDDPAVWRDVATSLQECIDYAGTVGPTLAVENHNHAGLIRTADDVFHVRSRVNGDLGLVLDLSNYVDGHESVDRTLHLADHVHAAYDDITDDGSEPNYDYYADVLADLNARNYDGYVTVEYEGEADNREAVPKALDYLRNAV